MLELSVCLIQLTCFAVFIITGFILVNNLLTQKKKKIHSPQWLETMDLRHTSFTCHSNEKKSNIIYVHA